LASLKEDPRTSPQDSIAGLVHDVIKVGTEFGFDSQLMISAPAALSKPPAERGEFDGLVFNQVEQQCSGALGKLTDLLESGEAGKVDRAAKVETAKHQLDTKIAKEKACREHLEVTEAALKEAEAEQISTETSLKAFGPEMASVEDALGVANSEQLACEEVLGVFRELVDAVTPAETELRGVEIVAQADTAGVTPAEPCRADSAALTEQCGVDIAAEADAA